jgi:hypothetical protein
MRGVACGPERRPITQEAHFGPATRSWSVECDGIEFVIGGGLRGPRHDRLEVAERVATRIAAFEAEADDYLAAFVTPDRFDAHRPWEICGIEFGIRPSDAADEFEVLLSLGGDTFGLWGVRFKFSGPPLDRFYPMEFRRRQR